ncbi:MAG: hypothetical protein U9Q96_01400 [Patescibacteria group bacterium]|nr:hypothetical protein [Patescibacteria group bacterium]
MIERIFQMIISPELQRALLPLKIVVFIFSILSLILIGYFLVITSYLKYLFLDKIADYTHWRHNYSPKAVKKAYQASHPVVDTPEPQTETTEPSESEYEELNFKEGRVERTDWERILDKLESNNELNYKLAFIDADKLLNQELEKKGKELSREIVSNVNDILKAKEILEKMLLNPKAELSLKRAREIIKTYERALSEING